MTKDIILNNEYQYDPTTGRVVVTISCEPKSQLDTYRSPQLECHVQHLLDRDYHFIALDMHNIAYISSLGASTLIRLRKECQKNGGRFVLYELPKHIKDILDILGANDVLHIHDSKHEAITELAAFVFMAKTRKQ